MQRAGFHLSPGLLFVLLSSSLSSTPPTLELTDTACTHLLILLQPSMCSDAFFPDYTSHMFIITRKANVTEMSALENMSVCPTELCANIPFHSGSKAKSLNGHQCTHIRLPRPMSPSSAPACTSWSSYQLTLLPGTLSPLWLISFSKPQSPGQNATDWAA